MRVLFIIVLLCLALPGFAQLLPDRYRAPVFDTISESADILFSEDVPQPTPGGGFWEFLSGFPLNANDVVTTPVDLFMNVFEPVGDTLALRPAVIICFGGGFLTGSRDYWSNRLLAEELAQSGFVTAIIDYRLGFNVFDPDLQQRSVYRAIQDSRAAVKYLRANADQFSIDTTEIYLGGHSAGAFMALHNLYLDKESERPISTYQWLQNGFVIPDLGTLDATGLATGVSGKANCAFSLAGALGFLSLIEDNLDGRTAMFHSQDDDTVPYDQGEPFGSALGFVLGSDVPEVFGSLQISLRCDTLSLVDTLHSYTSRGHGVHEASGEVLYPDIIPRIGDWFHTQRLQPAVLPLAGASFVCEDDLVQTYTVEEGDALYFDWQIQGGSFIDQCDTCNEATVMWSDTASTWSISVTPYNRFLARGTTQTIDVSLLAQATNSWLGGSGNWYDIDKWSLGRIPTPCEAVVINDDGSSPVVTVPTNSIINVRSVSTDGNVFLHLESGALLEVDP